MTFLIPACKIACVQGGVRPKWEQGSRVTYKVAPLALAPAFLRHPLPHDHRRNNDDNPHCQGVFRIRPHEHEMYFKQWTLDRNLAG